MLRRNKCRVSLLRGEVSDDDKGGAVEENDEVVAGSLTQAFFVHALFYAVLVAVMCFLCYVRKDGSICAARQQ